MFNSDVILGVKNKDFFVDDCKIVYAILTQSFEHLVCGSPVMVATVRKRNQSLAGINIFPARSNYGCGYMWIPENILKFIDKKPLCETHKAKNIDEFDYSQFNTIIESVKKYGGISFVSNKTKTAISILNSIKSIVREYNHSSLFQFQPHNNRFLSGEDDELLSIVSFFDLVHCVPLFNLKKIDGIGISFTQAIRKHSQLVGNQVNTFRLDIVVSNYEDNLFIIDGAIVDNKYPISNATYREIKLRIKAKLPIKKDKLKLKSKKIKTQESRFSNYRKYGLKDDGDGGAVEVSSEYIEETPNNKVAAAPTTYEYHHGALDSTTSY